MSHALYATHIQTLNTAHSAPLLARWSVAFAVAVTKWDARSRTRKHLTRLSDQHLRDIGLDHMSAKAEGAKPFWRD